MLLVDDGKKIALIKLLNFYPCEPVPNFRSEIERIQNTYLILGVTLCWLCHRSLTESDFFGSDA